MCSVMDPRSFVRTCRIILNAVAYEAAFGQAHALPSPRTFDEPALTREGRSCPSLSLPAFSAGNVKTRVQSNNAHDVAGPANYRNEVVCSAFASQVSVSVTLAP